jgi:hypothetical protein
VITRKVSLAGFRSGDSGLYTRLQIQSPFAQLAPQNDRIIGNEKGVKKNVLVGFSQRRL